MSLHASDPQSPNSSEDIVTTSDAEEFEAVAASAAAYWEYAVAAFRAETQRIDQAFEGASHEHNTQQEGSFDCHSLVDGVLQTAPSCLNDAFKPVLRSLGRTDEVGISASLDHRRTSDSIHKESTSSRDVRQSAGSSSCSAYFIQDQDELLLSQGSVLSIDSSPRSPSRASHSGVSVLQPSAPTSPPIFHGFPAALSGDEDIDQTEMSSLSVGQQTSGSSLSGGCILQHRAGHQNRLQPANRHQFSSPSPEIWDIDRSSDLLSSFRIAPATSQTSVVSSARDRVTSSPEVAENIIMEDNSVLASPLSDSSQHAVDGRYTLRIRNAQQINPYSYEKTYYKNQMKSNPEAIVNTDRRHMRDSPSQEGSSGENEDSDDEGWRQHRSDTYRKHSIKGHRHIVGLTANKEDSFLSMQRRSRRMKSSKTRHVTSNAPIQSSPQNGANTIRWYPKVFQQESSGEESNPLGECSQSEPSQAGSSKHDTMHTFYRSLRSSSPPSEMAHSTGLSGSVDFNHEVDKPVSRPYGKTNEITNSVLITEDQRHNARPRTKRCLGARGNILKCKLNTKRPRNRTGASKSSSKPKNFSRPKTRDRRRSIRIGDRLPSGVSIFPSRGKYIIRRLHRRQAETIDMEDNISISSTDSEESYSHRRQDHRMQRLQQIPPRDSSSDGHLFPTKNWGGVSDVFLASLAIHPPDVPTTFEFASDSYLRKGWLHELIEIISGRRPPPCAPEYELEGCLLPFKPTFEEFSTFLQSANAIMRRQIATLTPASEMLTITTTLHIICQTLSWLSVKLAGPEIEELRISALGCIDLLKAQADLLVDASMSHGIFPDARILHVYWFCLEISVRLYYGRSSPDNAGRFSIVLGHSLMLTQRLLELKVEDTLAPLLRVGPPLGAFSTGGSAAHVWICLIHLLWACSRPGDIHVESIWHLIIQALPMKRSSRLTFRGAAEAGEEIWHIIFTVIALSRFSVHGIQTSNSHVPPSWSIVAHAVMQVDLTARIRDDSTSRKRDKYIQLVVRRCLVLRRRCRWSLVKISVLINHLSEIFRSRRYSSLYDEEAGFPSFILQNSGPLVTKSIEEEQTFAIFLGLVMEAAEELQSSPDIDCTGQTKKLLSLVIPVGSVVFDNSLSPSHQELSMVYNRFSAIAVAIQISHSGPAVQRCLALAQHYVNFREANPLVHSISVDALRQFTLQLQYFGLPLDYILAWSTHVAQSILDGYQNVMKQDAFAHDRLAMKCLQFLFSSFNHILEAEMNEIMQVAYPRSSVGMISTNCLSNIMNNDFTLVKVYLSNCLSLLNAAQHMQETSHESQDYYEGFELDLDDPELSTALGESHG